MAKQEQWNLFKGSWISPKPVLPGIWRRKEGGHVVRARAKEGTTGMQKEIWKVLPESDEATALRWLIEEKARVRAGALSTETSKPRFPEFAAALFEEKVTVGDIRSARGRDKWRSVLEQLARGTEGPESGVFVPGFGDMLVERIHVTHVDTWKGRMAKLVAAGDYAPTTVNGWLGILRVVVKAAKRKLSLSHLATDGVTNFDLSEHDTYSEEEPNALQPEEDRILQAVTTTRSTSLKSSVVSGNTSGSGSNVTTTHMREVSTR